MYKIPYLRDNCLDFYNKCDDISHSGVYDIMLSDYELVYIIKKTSDTKYTYSCFAGRSFMNYTKDQFQQSLLIIMSENYYNLTNVDDCKYVLMTCGP